MGSCGGCFQDEIAFGVDGVLALGCDGLFGFVLVWSGVCGYPVLDSSLRLVGGSLGGDEVALLLYSCHSLPLCDVGSAALVCSFC